MHNANKRSAVLNPLDESDRHGSGPAASADIVVDCGLPGTGRRVRGIVPSWPIATDTWRLGRSPTLALPVRVVMKRDRFGVVRDECSSRGRGSTAGTPVLPPTVSLRHRSGGGSLGRTGRLFQPITLGTGDYIDFFPV